ncbi:MAG: AbrB/MazE/SpoVT family DNA-binding domain-containing protein [Desulfobacterales bacterium]
MQNNIELQIGKWVNSLGIRLPKHISEALHLRPKDKLSCAIENGKLVLKPLSRVKKYTLKELLAKVEEPSDEISWGKPEGEEVW